MFQWNIFGFQYEAEYLCRIASDYLASFQHLSLSNLMESRNLTNSGTHSQFFFFGGTSSRVYKGRPAEQPSDTVDDLTISIHGTLITETDPANLRWASSGSPEVLCFVLVTKYIPLEHSCYLVTNSAEYLCRIASNTHSRGLLQI